MSDEIIKYPDKLYKYTKLDIHSMDLLINSRLYFTSPLDFNDPFDCSAKYDITGSESDYKRLLNDIWHSEDIDNPTEMSQNIASFLSEDAKAEILTNTINLLRDGEYYKNDIESALAADSKEIGIICLTEIPDSILMFSHYAHNHAGFVIEFDASDITSRIGQCFNVTYQHKYPILNFFKASEKERFNCYGLTKADFWSYEKEWRILSHLKHECPGSYLPFEKKLLTGIIYGCRTSELDKQIVGYLTKEYPNIIYYQAKPRDDEYSLDILQL